MSRPSEGELRDHFARLSECLRTAATPQARRELVAELAGVEHALKQTMSPPVVLVPRSARAVAA